MSGKCEISRLRTQETSRFSKREKTKNAKSEDLAFNRVDDGARTHDPQNHNLML